MPLTVSLIKILNKFFPLPDHPLNRAAEGVQTTAEWQLARGRETLAYFLPVVPEAVLFRNRQVLDLGCGPGGKTCYYATQGASRVVGVDLLPQFITAARELAGRQGLTDRVTFVAADATALPFAADTFDVAIANDFMEHVGDPAAALREANRVLRPGGRLYVNFPPYYHPYGAHLSDAIGIPWVHRFFPEAALIQAYRELVRDYPDGEERLRFRLGRDAAGREVLSYVNRMTVARFRHLLREAGLNWRVAHYREVPLRGFFAPLLRFNGLKEYFVRMVVCVLEKGHRCEKPR